MFIEELLIEGGEFCREEGAAESSGGGTFGEEGAGASEEFLDFRTEGAAGERGRWEL